jgi:hypothetical protein
MKTPRSNSISILYAVTIDVEFFSWWIRHFVKYSAANLRCLNPLPNTGIECKSI